jgi:hypothetical protein
MFLSKIIAVWSIVQRAYPMTIHSVAGAVGRRSKDTAGETSKKGTQRAMPTRSI